MRGRRTTGLGGVVGTALLAAFLLGPAAATPGPRPAPPTAKAGKPRPLVFAGKVLSVAPARGRFTMRAGGSTRTPTATIAVGAGTRWEGVKRSGLPREGDTVMVYAGPRRPDGSHPALRIVVRRHREPRLIGPRAGVRP